MKNLIVLFNIKKIIISSYCHKYKDSSLKKNAHVTKNFHSMLIYFILTNTIAHCNKL